LNLLASTGSQSSVNDGASVSSLGDAELLSVFSIVGK
jgi:hypothetical protein